jgi:hypothetical protein
MKVKTWSLLRHSLARSRRRPAHHPDPVRPSRSERNRSLSPPLATTLACHAQSAGCAGAQERQVVRGGVNESATVRGGRHHSQRGSRLHRAQPFMAPLDSPQGPAGHRTLSYCCPRCPYRSVHQLRTSCHHLIQLVSYGEFFLMGSSALESGLRGPSRQSWAVRNSP